MTILIIIKARQEIKGFQKEIRKEKDTEGTILEGLMVLVEDRIL